MKNKKIANKEEGTVRSGGKMGKVGKVGSSTLVCTFLVVSEKAEGGMRFILGGFFLSYLTHLLSKYFNRLGYTDG